MEQREKLQLVIEQLEERIAPGVITKNNNGFGNGADGPLTDPGPGHSGDSNLHGFNQNHLEPGGDR